MTDETENLVPLPPDITQAIEYLRQELTLPEQRALLDQELLGLEHDINVLEEREKVLRERKNKVEIAIQVLKNGDEKIDEIRKMFSDLQKSKEGIP